MKADEALRYLELGFSVVPVYYGTKFPAKKIMGGSWSIFQERRASAEEVGQWFKLAEGNSLNLAVVCGPISGGLLILDFDYDAERTLMQWLDAAAPIAERLPHVRSGKGFHVYMKYAGECRTGVLAQSMDGKILIEARGKNNLCMLPGSRHPNGYDYRWQFLGEQDVPILDMSQLFHAVGAAAQLNQKPKKIVYAAPSRKLEYCSLEPYSEAALSGVVGDLSELRSGRNNGLNRAAYRLGRFVGGGMLARELVESELRRACEVNGYLLKDGEARVEATLKSGIEAGIQRPLEKK